MAGVRRASRGRCREARQEVGRQGDERVDDDLRSLGFEA
jgi:hypothetical protein